MININGHTINITIPEFWVEPCVKISNTQCHLAIIKDDNINIILVDTSMVFNGFAFNNADEIKTYINSQYL